MLICIFVLLFFVYSLVVYFDTKCVEGTTNFAIFIKKFSHMTNILYSCCVTMVKPRFQWAWVYKGLVLLAN